MDIMKSVHAAVVLCFLASALSAAEAEHTILGKPVGGYPIDHTGYSCGYKAKMGCSAWVAYRLIPDFLGKERTLKGNPPLFVDPAIAASGLSTPSRDELSDSSFFPLFFFTHDNALGRSPACEKEVYSLANVAAARVSETMPQVWKALDTATREWARDFKEVWVITGPVFSGQPERTASRKMAIPDAFYRIVTRKEGDSIKTIAFRIPQDASGSIGDYMTTIAEIEKETDLVFFPALSREKGKAVKIAKSVMWETTVAKAAPAAKGAVGAAKAAGKVNDATVDSGTGAQPAVAGDGKVWVLTEEQVYYRSRSKNYGKGNGMFMTEEEAGLLGFTLSQ